MLQWLLTEVRKQSVETSWEEKNLRETVGEGTIERKSLRVQ